MFRSLVAKEMLNNLLNARFAVAYALCVALMVGSTANMLTDYLARKRTYDHEASLYENAMTSPRGWQWWSAWNRCVARPPVLTQVFCIAGERQPDTRANNNPYFNPYFFGEPKQDVSGMLFPAVDMLFVIGILLSLVVFLLMSDTVSGERQAGTLRLVLSCPVPRDTLILAKWVGGFVCLALPYLASWVIVALLLVFTRSVTVAPGDWLRIAALMAIGMLYVATVFSLAMMVSVLVRGPEVSALTLMLVWVLILVALPSFSVPVSWLSHPGPGVQQAQLEMQRAITRGRGDLYKSQQPDEIARRFGTRREDELSREEYEEFRRLHLKGRKVSYAFGRDRSFEIMRRDFARLTGMDHSAGWLMRLSPAGCLQRAFTTVAGTGLERERELSRAMEQFSPAAYEASEEQGATGRLPHVPFVVPRTPAGKAVTAALLDVGILALMGLLFFLVAFGVFVRSEVQ